MARKLLNATMGIKVKTVFNERKNKESKKCSNEKKEEERENCLNCGKPAEKCKGACYGKNK